MTGPANLRDLGGLALHDAPGRTTRPEVLLRGDAPLPGDADPVGITAWPPAVVVDLRSPGEADDPHALAGRAVIHRVPLTARAAVTVPAAGAREVSLTTVYRDILDESASELASIVGIVAHADGPTLVHCGAGRDRTGIAAAILLLLAGVSADEVVADYAASAQRMPALIERLTALGRTPRMLDAADPATLAAPPARIGLVIERVTTHPGGVVGWAVEHGARRDDIELLRHRFAPEPPTREDHSR